MERSKTAIKAHNAAQKLAEYDGASGGSPCAHDQLARRSQILCGRQAGRREQRQRFIQDATLGERDGQGSHPTILPNRYCRAVRTFAGGAIATLVRKGLMSIPPRRVKRA